MPNGASSEPSDMRPSCGKEANPCRWSLGASDGFQSTVAWIGLRAARRNQVGRRWHGSPPRSPRRAAWAGARHSFLAQAGSRMVARAPRASGRLASSSVPPCSLMICWETASPSPVPWPRAFVVKNGSKSLSWCSGAIPEAGVIHLHRQPGQLGEAGSNRDRAAFRRRLDGVEQQVQHHLLDLIAIQRKRRARHAPVALDDEALAVDLRLHQSECPLRNFVKVGRPDSQRTGPGKIQHFPDHAARLRGRVPQRVEHEFLRRFALRSRIAEDIRGHQDGGQRVLHLVGQSGGQPAEHFQLCCLDHLHPRRLQFGVRFGQRSGASLDARLELRLEPVKRGQEMHDQAVARDEHRGVPVRKNGPRQSRIVQDVRSEPHRRAQERDRPAAVESSDPRRRGDGQEVKKAERVIVRQVIEPPDHSDQANRATHDDVARQLGQPRERGVHPRRCSRQAEQLAGRLSKHRRPGPDPGFLGGPHEHSW